ncbi:DUF2812 domain-containing protein [Bacillus haynesii]|nr:DUF2812 domain-containing protein [Bacillus haynesii]
MSKKRKRKFRFFLAWQDRKEENWLNEMAKKGWMLKSFFLFFYIFEKTKPSNTVYRLDYKTTSNLDQEEYIHIYEDAGWKHVTQFLNWHYFAADPSQVQTNVIYTDRESEAEKYNGLLKVLYAALASVFLSSGLPLLIIDIPGYFYWIEAFNLFVLCLLIVCILKVRKKTRI